MVTLFGDYEKVTGVAKGSKRLATLPNLPLASSVAYTVAYTLPLLNLATRDCLRLGILLRE